MFLYVESQIKAVYADIERVSVSSNYFSDQKIEKTAHITSPLPQSHVSSPVTISGSVSGRWFFEGSIIGQIVDKQGNVLGQGPLNASGDWMTAKDVSFNGVIPFVVDADTEGYVVIKADDPEGGGTAKSMRIPVIIDAPSETSNTKAECSTATVASNGFCMR